jgi:hypothetical protein
MSVVEENSDDFFHDELSNHSGPPAWNFFEDIDVHV